MGRKEMREQRSHGAGSHGAAVLPSQEMPRAARADKEVSGPQAALGLLGCSHGDHCGHTAGHQPGWGGRDTSRLLCLAPIASREQRQLGKGTTGSSLNLKIAT